MEMVPERSEGGEPPPQARRADMEIEHNESGKMSTHETRELFLGEGPGTGGNSQHLFVNLGPAHPAMHGIIRIFAELDGEMIVKADVEIGYLHRAFEKDCEIGPYNNAIPFTDRLNYVSPSSTTSVTPPPSRSSSASRSPSAASTSA